MSSTKPPAYTQIQHHQDFDDDDDNHNAATRTLGGQRSFLHRYCCSSPWVQGVLNVILVLVVLGLLLERRAPATTTFEGSGDVTGFVPPMGQQIKTFVPNMSFVPENGSHFFTNEVKDMWLSIVPSMLIFLYFNFH